MSRTQEDGAVAAAAGQIEFRPAGCADAEAIRSFIVGLSPRTQYRRFFAGVSPPSSALLRGMCGAENGADIVVATRRVPGRGGPDRGRLGGGPDCGRLGGGPDRGRLDCGRLDCGRLDCGGQVIGHAMAADRVTSDGTRTVDVGLVVADASQRRGVGSALMRVLLARAFARGARTAVMEVLPGNADVLAMIARRWPAASYESTTDSVVVRACLTAPAMTVAHAPAVVAALVPAPAPSGVLAGQPS